MNVKIVVGANVESVSQMLVEAISSIPPNKVVELNSKLSTKVLPFLSPELKKTEALFGLKLTLISKQSMAHSGWLYSRYLDACRKSKVDPAAAVALYSEGLFREFNQFGVLDSEALFLGFGKKGTKMLKCILQAEFQFDPNNFDIDGYTK